MPGVGYLNGNPDQGHVLVVVFLRGGADGLTLVPPVEDDGYYRARPQIAVAKGDTTPLDGPFGLHRRLGPLARHYDEGRLAVIHRAGSEDGTRSHFEAQDLMEHGGLTAGGWLGRHLRFRPGPACGPLAAVAIGPSAPEVLRGAPSAVTLESFHAFSFGETGLGFGAALAALYGDAPAPLGSAGRETLAAMARLESLRSDDYRPTGGAEYGSDAFADGLRHIAQLIKARVGLEAATIDLDGWDAHFGSTALMDPLMETLGAGLGAFASDLGHELARTTVVVMSEFGRRVYENVSLGTDHGRGGAMFVLGGGVQGGRVLGGWDGLDVGMLEGPGDVPVACNYRQILAEILARRHGDGYLNDVFPGYALAPAGLYG